MTSLGLLGKQYGSDSDSSSAGDEKTIDKISKFPLPNSISSLFSSQPTKTSNAQDHQGRTRTFAHERGNWASSIYIPYPIEQYEDLKKHIEKVFNADLNWNSVADFHLSLSKTFVIPHHCIDPIVNEVREMMAKIDPFEIAFHPSDLKLYVNDDRTRSFCGFEVTTSSTCRELKHLVSIVDEILVTFKCETYYALPSFHLSIAWCLGDITKTKGYKHVICKLIDSWNVVYNDDDDLFHFVVNTVLCKFGNKVFNCNFSRSS